MNLQQPVFHLPLELIVISTLAKGSVSIKYEFLFPVRIVCDLSPANSSKNG
jgi:hypothetical protein